MVEGIRCPVCGKYTFDEEDDYDICEVCHWENDGFQWRHPDYRGGANRISLNEARAIYREKLRRESEKREAAA